MRISLLNLIFSTSAILAQHNKAHSRDLYYEHNTYPTVSYRHYSTRYPRTTTSKTPTPTTTCTSSKKTRIHRNKYLKKRQFFRPPSETVEITETDDPVENTETGGGFLFESSAFSETSEEDGFNKRQDTGDTSDSSDSDVDVDGGAVVGAKEKPVFDSDDSDNSSEKDLKKRQFFRPPSETVEITETDDPVENTETGGGFLFESSAFSETSEEDGFNKRQETGDTSDSSDSDMDVDDGAAVGAKEEPVFDSEDSDNSSEKDLKKRMAFMASYSYTNVNDRQNNSLPYNRENGYSTNPKSHPSDRSTDNKKYEPNSKNDHPYKKNHSDSRNGGSTNSDKPKPNGYYLNGRYWHWNSRPGVAFMNSLEYKPSYADQRFQYLYTYLLEFKKRWNSRPSFRLRWNRSSRFRSEWFSKVDFNKSKKH
ncbi:hypothetical protein AYI68_g5997 [Smittium mucronatum]|uniref:Uncharacterized protein n=1 Tax=Smittium mucronatum TaxID=133383 RepID=A0A1R0GSQ5_9FUNG|nr:hypothetical protein AYI68_g5997 [Smittium mucronatum]